MKHDAISFYSQKLKKQHEKIGPDLVFNNHLLKYVANKKFMDLGCGIGYYLSEMGEGSVGLDASSINVGHAHESLDIRQVDLNGEINPGTGFDGIFASHVIEHLLSPVEFIEKCSNILDKGQLFILGVPTENAIDRIFYPYGFSEDIRHFYSFTYPNLKYLVERCDFKITARYISFTGMGRMKSRRFERVLQKIIPFRLGLFLSKGYYVVCEKV
jgi:SAM-dependent methyltransferase